MKLSKLQNEIVYSDAPKIIVDAGSGSGKTRVLTERVRRLLLEGVNPKSMVVITFTNTAANELKKRLYDVPGHDKCFIGTIHSYANSLLKKSSYEYEIFSEQHQTNFMKLLIARYALECKFEDYLRFLQYDRKVAAGHMDAEEVFAFFEPAVYNELLCLLGRKYTVAYPETVYTMCKDNNVIFFDDLIKMATDWFQENNLSLEYLFVDELQDIGYLEYNFLMTLNATNCFVIGDDYQSIFGFKGGDVQIFLSLMENPEWKSYTLAENYRTAKNILLYANAIIKKASDIISKDIVIMRDEAGSLEFKSKAQLYDFLGTIKPGEDWFILTRTNKEMCSVDKMLYSHGIEHYCFKRSTVSAQELEEIMSRPCIKVMTVHAAKGLECDNVALYGKFPTRRFDNSDEVKVYYVGLTRAKNKCLVFV